MATVNIRFGGVMGGGASVYETGGRYTDITTSATSSATTMTAEAGDYARVTAYGGAVRIAIGQAPVAAAPGMLLGDGAVVDIGPLKRGDKVAAIDA